MREVPLPPKNIVIGQPVSPEKAALAKEFRSNMTFAERTLWEKLRANRLEGLHFRRQQVIAGFIVDFYCHQEGLIVEVDGSSHKDQAEYDAHRDEVLASLSLRVLRVTNQDVIHHMEQVLERIRDVCC